VDPDFTQYAREVRRLKVKGVFISKATDEELSEVFKEMHVSVTHKVELREAVAAWRADPQLVMLPPCAAAAPAFLPL
jgi:acetone carboxylase gamma subunit